MSGEPYAARKRLNEASRFWATRNAEAWTDSDDMYILEMWIMRDPAARSEVEVSQKLERTIEACRARAEIIRKRLGIQVFEVTKKVVVEVNEACPDCWLVHPTGQCDR